MCIKLQNQDKENKDLDKKIRKKKLLSWILTDSPDWFIYQSKKTFGKYIKNNEIQLHELNPNEEHSFCTLLDLLKGVSDNTIIVEFDGQHEPKFKSNIIK